MPDEIKLEPEDERLLIESWQELGSETKEKPAPKPDSGKNAALRAKYKAMRIHTKAQGLPCKQGETAARSGCIPATDDYGTMPHDTEDVDDTTNQQEEPLDYGTKPSNSDPSEVYKEHQEHMEDGGKDTDTIASLDTLKNAAIIGSKRLKGGINESLLVDLEDGSKGVFKPDTGEEGGVRSSVEAGTYWRREIAASSVADILGFDDLVPKTTQRTYNGNNGSIQAFVPGCDVAAKLKDPWDGVEDQVRAAVFDYLTGHVDRHQGNWLVKNAGKGKLVLIDNGLSFPVNNGGGPYGSDFAFATAAQAMELVRAVAEDGHDVPDLSGWEGKWDEVEKALTNAGIEKEAIALTRERFNSLIMHSGKPFRYLRNYGNKNQTLMDLFKIQE